MRREHIASPRSPPVRGLATDSGRRSGIQFYGGRSVQKGELEFKPMFNKKNIAKLLVFAMLLTMLPVSTVAAGTETTPPTPVSKEVGAYVTVKDAYATSADTVYMTKADTDYKFSTDTGTVTLNSEKKIMVSFTAVLTKENNKTKAAGLKIWYGNDYLTAKDTDGYTVSEDTTYTVKQDITITESDAQSKDVQFTLVPVDANGKELDAREITLTIPLKDEGKNPTPSGDVTYAVMGDSVTVTGKQDADDTHKTITLTKPTGNAGKGSESEPYKFTSDTYVVATDSKTVEVSFSTTNAALVTYSIGNDTKWTNETASHTNNGTYKISVDVSGMMATDGKVSVTVYVKVSGGADVTETYNELTFDVWVGKPAEYTITVTNPTNGTVTTSPANKAVAGAEVLITASPNDGYEVNAITVTDASGSPIEVKSNKFTMPASNVTVTVTFKKAGGTTPPEEPDDPTTEDGYTIAPDVYTKTQKTGVPFTLSAEVSYKVDEDTTIGVDADKIAWSVSSDDLTASDYSLSKKYDSDSYKASADVTISKTGKATIKLSFTKPDGKQMSHDFEVTVEEDKGSNEKPYRVRLDVTPKDAGSIAFKNANSAYFGETDTVTVVVTPKDETKYTLNRVTVYQLQGDTDVYADNGTNVDPATGETNTYTFTMPASNVKVIAVFEEVSTGKKVETVKVKSSVAFDDLKEGWALPELTLDTTDGVTAIAVKWTDESGAEVKGAFPSIGRYTFTITPTIASGYTIGADVKYTLDGKELEGTVSPDGTFTGTLTLDETDKRKLGASFHVDRRNSPANGYVTITGMSALKWYCVSVAKTDDITGGTAAAEIVLKGSDTGSTEIPVEPGVTLNIKEMDGNTKQAFNKGYLFVSEADALDVQDTTTFDLEIKPENYDMTGVFTEETNDPGDSQPGDLHASFVEDRRNIIGNGILKITGTSSTKWYCVSVTKTDDITGGTAALCILVKGSDTGLEIPVEPGVNLNIKEMKGSDKTAFNRGYLFVAEEDATHEKDFTILTQNKPQGWDD